MASTSSRFGWSIKKALGNAVRRNRIRRRLREILRLHRQEIAPGWDIVIHPRSSAATAEFSALEAELLKVMPAQREGAAIASKHPRESTRTRRRVRSLLAVRPLLQNFLFAIFGRSLQILSFVFELCAGSD